MVNHKLNYRILTLISQTYAIPLIELENLYQEVNSIDVILDIIEISKNQNINLSLAINMWKEDKK